MLLEHLTVLFFFFFLVTLRLELCPAIYRSSALSVLLRCGGVGRYEGERSEVASKSISTCLSAYWSGEWAGRWVGVDGHAKALTLVW